MTLLSSELKNLGPWKKGENFFVFLPCLTAIKQINKPAADAKVFNIQQVLIEKPTE